MKTLFTVIGTLLTLFVVLYRSSPSNPESLFFQFLIIMGIPISIGISLAIEIIRRVNPLTDFVLTPANRYSFTGLLTLLLILPIGHAYLLNDFVFILITVVISWVWISWSFYLGKRW